MNEYSIKLLILSRGRSQTITTTEILPDFVEVLVPESEEAAYRAAVKNPILTIPDNIIGLGRVRNWVLQHFEERIIVMLDDDLIRLYCLTAKKARPITDPEEITQVIINAAVMADDAGLHCFGFSQTDIRKFNGCEPFKLTGWVGGVIGVIGRQYTFRDDKYKVDIDFCMKNMLVDRILWIDDRYCFYQLRDNNVGGNSAFRTQEEYEASTESLVEKWKGYLTKSTHASQVFLRTKVKRKQDIKL
ncbi:hypothetical protein AALA82_01050 [Oscillospiraceae bacterium 50-16]